MHQKETNFEVMNKLIALKLKLAYYKLQKYYYLPIYYTQQIVFKVEIAFVNTFEDSREL